MDRMSRFFGNLPGFAGTGAPEAPLVDSSEKVQISSLALLKMLKHGRAGVPMEVMGLMLGQFVDDYTINCVDVFAMPQSGTGVSVSSCRRNTIRYAHPTGRSSRPCISDKDA
mmetsp:Transcript_15240/g.45652  ORF Transcript_15240/g.45652 Transcript_15240/m.45652 type:complete len:112 (+) Transcript_15240:141-476(+)